MIAKAAEQNFKSRPAILN